jgi:hypothetical protein
MKTNFYFLLITVLFLTLFSTANAATYVVDRADDVAGATACTAAANDCSLRGAIINANANGAGADTIQFNVNGGNAQTITMSSTALPVIQTSLTIDGTTQPLFGGLPLVEINGAASIVNTNGFQIQSPAAGTPLTVTIKSLVINRFQGSGIFFNASGGITATVLGCYIGVNPGGSIDQGNGNDGIRISAYPDSSFTIGGTATSERNIISGNQSIGIDVTTALGFQNAGTTVTVLNNFIGTTAGGNVDLGNSGDGINFGGPGLGYTLQVGNGLANGRNIISGNDGSGVVTNSGAVSIIGNYIGTSLNGNAKVGNTLDGIQLMSDTSSAAIGGTVIGIPLGNVISGNGHSGILVNDASIAATIRNNKIGTNAAGTAALGNGGDGIRLSELNTFTTSSIVIGSDTDASDGNTISGNDADGIEIDEMVMGVKVYANKIGTNDAVTATLPNGSAGMRIQSAANQIGESGNNVAANVISGNNLFGMMIVGAQANGNKVYNNYIGTNAAGANLGNLQDGIYINQDASSNNIGSGFTGGTNKIAFNGSDGINVSNGQNNSINANSIYSNVSLGIDLNSDDVTNNDPGDTDAGPNDRQNFPVIGRATPSRITATFNSKPNSFYDIEYYRVDSCDASGFGEGRYYLGTLDTAFTDANGNADVSMPFALSVGQFVTATATTHGGSAGNTSEFSQCVAVTGEPGNLSLSASAYTVNESSATRTIVVNRTGGSTGAIQVNYATSNGTATAGQDYTTASGTLLFSSGQVVNSFDIPVNNDTLDETDETVNITLSSQSPGVFLTPNGSAVMTIIDNDAPPTVLIEDVSQFEGNLGTNQFSFRVSLSAASGLPVSVDYVTANGTATASSDYAFAGGPVNFAPGETLKSVLVTIIGDLTPELDETFFINLSNPVNASFGDNQALGTIKDDDNPGKFSFSLAPYSGTEHDSVPVTVTRTNGTAGTVTVDYATQGGSATPITDYQPVSGTLVFGDGETTKTFFVAIADDAVPEPAETVNLVLSNPIGGASIGNPSVAVLNIIDNDNGALLSLAGVVKLANNSPVQNVTMTLQGAQNAVTTTDNQGRYSFANLAPNGNYTVTPSAIGYTFAPLSQQFNNLASDNLGVNFTATAAPSRQLRVIGGGATPGQNVTATVELVAQGDENAVGFSLNYDQAILMNPNVVLNPDASTAFLTVNGATAGKLGVLLALPAGQAFTVGTKSLVTITFNTMPTSAFNSPVTFGDAPLAREITNTNANELAANYLDGAVTFAQGYEADVAPRPTGSNNGTITITDFTQVGRFVANLDTLNPNFNEFQRADCAPRISSGNGSLTVADYTQAGRYAASLDPVSPTGGASIPSLVEFDETGKLLAAGSNLFKGADQNLVPTVVRAVNTQASPGGQVTVSIETDAQGTENGFGFTLNYDATKLSAPVVAKGADTQSATLIPNTNTAGKIGVVLGMPFNTGVPAGTRQIVTIQFNVAANASGGLTPLTFSDAPVVREVSDINANVLQSNFTDGAVNILGPTAASVTIGGKVHDVKGNPLAQVRITLTDPAGQTRIATTNTFGNYRFANVEAGQTYVLTASGKRYVFNDPTQIVTVTDNLENLDFVGSN